MGGQSQSAGGPATGTSVPSSPIPATRDRSQRRRYAALGAVLAVAVVVILLVSGLIPGVRLFGSGTSSSAGPDTESQAVTAASGILGSTPGGPWSLSEAGGNAFIPSWPVNWSFLAAGPCGFHGGELGNVSLGPYSGAYASGVAVTWGLTFVGPTNSSGALGIIVENGDARLLGIASLVGSCAGQHVPIGAPVVDSSIAMKDVLDTTNGTRFAEMFSRANVTYALSPGSPGPFWDVYLNGCGLYRVGAGTILSQVWASNGSVDIAPRAPTSC
jgi:hypothetical protein